MSNGSSYVAPTGALVPEDANKASPRPERPERAPRAPQHRKPINIVIGLVFLLGTGVIAVNLYSIGSNVSSEKQYEAIVKVLIAIVSGYLSFYFLVQKHAHDTAIEQVRHEHASILEDVRLDNASVIEKLRGEISKKNDAEINAQKSILDTRLAIIQNELQLWMKPELLRLESKAAASQKHAELVLEDDFRRRVRRDAAILEFSKQLNVTMRAFRALTTFNLSRAVSTEALVNTLASALAARQQFLLARDALDDLHVVRKDHEKEIFRFSEVLMDIIIDIRRADDAGYAVLAEGQAQPNQKLTEVMASHKAKLESLNSKMGIMLNFFLAPHEEPPPKDKDDSRQLGRD